MRTRRERIAAWLAFLVAGLAVAATIRFNTFVPWGTDAAAYIEAAHRWADGRLATPSPLPLWAPWAQDSFVVAPFGFRPGAIRGTEVSQYPPGFPIIMAAAILTGGELAAYVVAPLSAGLLIWCSYVLGARLSGPWAGLLAAVLVAASPITLVSAVQPMSDVPGAALWALAWVMSLRPGLGASAAAGASVAAAIMVRPNLAPLAAVMGGLILAQGTMSSAPQRWPWRCAVLFGSVAAIGPGVMAWSQAELYGNPFVPGYLGWESFYRVAHIQTNLTMYPRHLMTVHTPLVFAGLVAAILPWRRNGPFSSDASARAVALSAAAVVAINYLLYLPYVSYDDLHFLRFLLPAVVALFVLLAGLLVRLARVLRLRSRLLASLALVPALVVAAYPARMVQYAFDIHRSQARIPVMGRYLREVLPKNAAVLASLQGGAIAHYTGRLIVRLDPIASGSLDAIVDDLVRHGYRPVLLLDEALEAASFATRFAGSRLEKLDWPPRAQFRDRSGFLYFDVADRDAYRLGTRWPIDVLSALK